MVSQKDLLLKRVGYLGCSLTLHQDHQFMLLLVNTILSDLRSDNYLEVSRDFEEAGALCAARCPR